MIGRYSTLGRLKWPTTDSGTTATPWPNDTKAITASRPPGCGQARGITARVVAADMPAAMGLLPDSAATDRTACTTGVGRRLRGAAVGSGFTGVACSSGRRGGCAGRCRSYQTQRQCRDEMRFCRSQLSGPCINHISSMGSAPNRGTQPPDRAHHQGAPARKRAAPLLLKRPFQTHPLTTPPPPPVSTGGRHWTYRKSYLDPFSGRQLAS